MSAYQAPLKDMRFVLKELAGLDGISKLPGYQDATPDTVDAILEEAAKFATNVLGPLNRGGPGSKARTNECLETARCTAAVGRSRPFVDATQLMQGELNDREKRCVMPGGFPVT